MTEEQPTIRKSELMPSRLVATALAAVTAAFLGSMLGTAGTVVGAGVASVVTTFAGAIYQRSLDRTRTTLRQRVATVRTTRGTVASTGNEPGPASGSEPEVPAGSVGETSDAPAPSPIADAALGAEPLPAEHAPTEPQPTQKQSSGPGYADGLPADRPPTGPRRKLNWRVAALVTVMAFALGIGAVTGQELLRGHPNSGGTSGTSIGSLYNQATGQPTSSNPSTHPTPTANPSGTRRPSPSATTTPTATSTPSGTPSPTTSAQRTGPTTATLVPTTGAATPTTP